MVNTKSKQKLVIQNQNKKYTKHTNTHTHPQHTQTQINQVMQKARFKYKHHKKRLQIKRILKNKYIQKKLVPNYSKIRTTLVISQVDTLRAPITDINIFFFNILTLEPPDLRSWSIPLLVLGSYPEDNCGFSRRVYMRSKKWTVTNHTLVTRSAIHAYKGQLWRSIVYGLFL